MEQLARERRFRPIGLDVVALSQLHCPLRLRSARCALSIKNGCACRNDDGDRKIVYLRVVVSRRQSTAGMAPLRRRIATKLTRHLALRVVNDPQVNPLP